MIGELEGKVGLVHWHATVPEQTPDTWPASALLAAAGRQTPNQRRPEH